MKKNIFVLLLVVSAVSLALFAAACGDGGGHEHVYDCEVAESQFLKSEATCSKKAEYYYSCACGEKGSSTFTYGELGAHNLKHVDKVPETCTSNGTDEYWICSGGCGRMFADANATEAISDLSWLVIPAAHKLTHHEEESATCTKDGVREYWSCSVCKLNFADASCDEQLTDLVIPAAHVGWKDNVCTGCGYNAGGTAGLEYVPDSDGLSYIVTKGAVNSGTVEIPATYNGLPIKTISSFADSAITAVTIPDGAEIIAGNAFRGCASLKKVTVPDSVTQINYQAFWDCASLTDVRLPENITNIGNNLFEGCVSLTEIEIPSAVKAIYTCAFRGCISLKSISLPEKLEEISDLVFSGCTTLTSMVIPESVSDISENAFYNCPIITLYCETSAKPAGWDDDWNNLGYGDKIPVVWNCKENDCDANGFAYAFAGGIKYALKDGKAIVVRQPHSIKIAALRETVEYKNTEYAVTEITDDAFCECLSLGEAVIPRNIEVIGANAFRYCSALTSVTLPSGVRTVGASAFDGCNALTIYCETSLKPDGWAGNWCDSNVPVVWSCKQNDRDEDGFAYTVANGIRFALKDGKATVAAQPRNSSGNIVIPSKVTYSDEEYTVTELGASFQYNSLITGVTIPDGVNKIADRAFLSCTSLSRIDVDENNAHFKSVNGVLYSKDGNRLVRFAGGKDITSFAVPDTVTEIYNNAFDGCAYLTDISIPDSVTRIGQYAFANCNNDLRRCENGVFYVDKWAVSGLENATEFALSSGTAGIADCAFLNCRLLERVSLGDGLKYIGAYAFYGCDLLSAVEIPDSVVLLGSVAFSGCGSLSQIVIGTGINAIADGTFYGCSPTAEVYYRGTEAEWNEIEIAQYDSIRELDRYYYSETGGEGNLWHYVDGVVTKW